MITLLFLDFTGTLHTWFGWLAKIQFLPAVLALNVGVILLWVVLTLVLGGSVGPVTIGIMLLMGPAVDLVGGWAKRTLYRG